MIPPFSVEKEEFVRSLGRPCNVKPFHLLFFAYRVPYDDSIAFSPHPIAGVRSMRAKATVQDSNLKKKSDYYFGKQVGRQGARDDWFSFSFPLTPPQPNP